MKKGSDSIAPREGIVTLDINRFHVSFDFDLGARDFDLFLVLDDLASGQVKKMIRIGRDVRY
jgi:hypothetical protein